LPVGDQTLIIGVLRAYRVTMPGAVIAIVARWGVGLGGGYWLTCGSPAMGVQGFWCGGTAAFVVAGAAAVSVYLAMRARLQNRVAVARQPPTTLDLRAAAADS
jgi:Na+-driven multidrug efflux pump